MILIVGGSGFIGFHLVSRFCEINLDYINMDIRVPKYPHSETKFVRGSIENQTLLESIFSLHKISTVVNLSANTNLTSRNYNEFTANTVGVNSLVRIMERFAKEVPLIHFSTQHVIAPGYTHAVEWSDQPYLGLYGFTKRVGEEIVKLSALDNWTILRPALVWGSHNEILLNGLLKPIIRRKYVHPSEDSVVRGYTYVGTLINCIEQIFNDTIGTFRKNVYYVADGNFRQSEWIENLNRSLTRKSLPRFPRAAFWVGSFVGEVGKRVSIEIPINRARYRNLTTSNPVPLVNTFKDFDMNPKDSLFGFKDMCEWAVNETGFES